MTLTAHIFHNNGNLEIHDSLDFLNEFQEQKFLWIDIESSDEVVLNQIAQHFSLHELTIEDCLTPGHAPKLEDFGSYVFMIFRAMNPQAQLPQVLNEEYDDNDNEEEEVTRSLAIFLAKDFVITHRMNPMPWLDAYLRQVKRRPQQIFNEGPQLLTHRIVDVLVDRFQRSLSYFEDQIDHLEDLVIQDPDAFDMQNVLDLKRQLGTLKHIMRDQRTVVTRLSNDATLVEDKQLRRYFRNIEEQSASTINTIDKQIDNLVGLRDMYFAMANVRLGDIMRVLAVITTIAVPLNLVVGLYGMNFDAIPLLHNQYGFWLIMGIMLFVAVCMLYFFRRNRWL